MIGCHQGKVNKKRKLIKKSEEKFSEYEKTNLHLLMFRIIFKSLLEGLFGFGMGVHLLGGWLFVECKALALPPTVN